MKPAETLARAFEFDPGFEWVLPDHTSRRRRLEHVFRSALAHCNRVGGIAEIDGSAAAGIWSTRTTMEIGLFDAVRTGSAALPFRLGVGPMSRLQRHEEEGDGLVRDSVSGDFAYLMALGVDPDRRGEGLGRRVVDLVGAQATSAGHGRLALRTENASNVEMYRHLGFDLMGNGIAATSGLRVWVMARSLG
jgi:GNAT superfamily N-acetyltransferase